MTGALLAIFLLLGGCATRLTPPPAASLAQPVAVYLVDDGGTSSLVLPAPAGPVLYAYGDWEWYALRHTTSPRAVAALFWPTQGALGRRHLLPPAAPESIARQLHPENLYALSVEASRAEQLRRALEAIFEHNRATRVDTPDVGLEFVHHPESYTLLHDSNHMTAKWLGQLGVRVRGVPILSIWQLSAPPYAVKPPSIVRLAPVTKPLSGPAR